MIKEGNIYMASLPQKDGMIKVRPILILKKRQRLNDWLVCGISSNIELEIEGYNYIIDNEHIDFNKSGLEMPSVIRVGYLAALTEDRILKKIGNLSKGSFKTILDKLHKDKNAKIYKFESLPE